MSFKAFFKSRFGFAACQDTARPAMQLSAALLCGTQEISQMLTTVNWAGSSTATTWFPRPLRWRTFNVQQPEPGVSCNISRNTVL